MLRTVRPRLGRLGWVLEPVARFGDAVLRYPQVPFNWTPRSGIERHAATGNEISRARIDLERCPTLSVVETCSELEWLLADMRRASGRGSLEAAIVTSGSRVLGWHIHFARPGGLSQVVQFGGSQESIDDVFTDLLHRAAESGALALSGALDPRYIQCLTKQGCTFRQTYSFLLHSNDQEIIKPIMAGDANITRMNGEWWMHFADGPW